MRRTDLILFASFLIAANGCTFLKYTETPAPTADDPDPEPTKELTIADLRISGSAIDLSATLAGKGTLEVNREQGSAGSAAAEVIDAAASSPLSVLGR